MTWGREAHSRMRAGATVGLALAITLATGVIALADSFTVDTDAFTSGNQNIVELTAQAGTKVETSGTVLVSYSGGKNSAHLLPNQSLVFTKNANATTLPAGHTVEDATVNIGSTWGEDSWASGESKISFKAPATPAEYSYTVKWTEPSNPSCTSGAGQCLTGSAALVIKLTVKAAASTNTAPTLTLANIGPIEGNTLGGALVTFANGASDNEDGNLSAAIVCDRSETDVFPVGTTTVNCSVTDSGNLTTSGSFTVQVVDTTPPVLTLPATITTGPTNAYGATPTWLASALDIVDGATPVTCSHGSGTQFGFGATTVNCGSSDASGNSASGSFDVQVNGFTLDGFYTPVSMKTPNSVKAGSTVPIKWRLFGEAPVEIKDTAAVLSVSANALKCDTGAMLFASDAGATSTSAAGLRYDESGQQFVFNWKVPAQKDACYKLTASFRDGTSLSANFITK